MTYTNSHLHAATSNKSTKHLLLAFCIIINFMIIETIGGLYSGSLALLTDAGHMLTDAVSLLLAMLAIRFARKPPNTYHTFGWLRLTTLTAFINAIMLIITALVVIWEAMQRLGNLQPITGITMIIIAIVGMITNLVVFWILHHSREEKNLNIQAAILHVICDLLSSIGAIAAALIILYTGWTPIDPILSILVSFLILLSVWTLLKQIINELLEGAPILLDLSELKSNLCRSIPEVHNVHHVHVWQVGERPIITLHVHVIQPHDHDALLVNIQHFLKYKYKILHATIQMEYQLCSETDCYINNTRIFTSSLLVNQYTGTK